jgi:hypothetical protein
MRFQMDLETTSHSASLSWKFIVGAWSSNRKRLSPILVRVLGTANVTLVSDLRP